MNNVALSVGFMEIKELLENIGTFKGYQHAVDVAIARVMLTPGMNYQLLHFVVASHPQTSAGVVVVTKKGNWAVIKGIQLPKNDASGKYTIENMEIIFNRESAAIVEALDDGTEGRYGGFLMDVVMGGFGSRELLRLLDTEDIAQAVKSFNWVVENSQPGIDVIEVQLTLAGTA